MRILTSLFLVLFASNVFAHNDKQGPLLLTASSEVLSFVDLYTETEDITAWEVGWDKDHTEEVYVNILSVHGHHQDILSFECDLHHDHFHCHKHDDDHHFMDKSSTTFDRFDGLVQTEHKLQARVKNQLSRLGGWDEVNKYKLWVELDYDHDHDHKSHHGHGYEYWAKVVFNNGREVFYNCHEHSHESGDLSCHLRRHGDGGPDFGDSHTH